MIQVSRYYFYDSPTGTLSFEESSPEKPKCEEHHVCNCTRTVNQKPKTIPASIQQGIIFETKFNKCNLEVDLSNKGCKFTFRWPDTLKDPDGFTQRNHAYFWFDDNNHIQIERSLKGYGNVSCFFANLYFGNNIDISRFMNGHSPSRVVDLSKIDKDAIWCHECGYGGCEVYAELQKDWLSWWQIYNLEQGSRKRIKPYCNNFEMSVSDIRAAVSADDKLLADVDDLSYYFFDVANKLQESELFRVGDYCRKKASEKYLEKK